MKYDIKIHGDSLEKEFYEFINTNFSTYTKVWQLYIGNRGNNIKASIEGYPTDRDQKRQEFSEHTYTILQSVVVLSRLTTNEIFEKARLNNIHEVLDLQDCLLLFFTHLGRIRDNTVAASKCLLNSQPNDIANVLEEFYHKRHILVHGKMLPILFHSNGNISIPLLSRSTEDQAGWNHKFHNWRDLGFLPTEHLSLTIVQLFYELLAKLNHIFGQFEKSIASELKAGRYELKFEIESPSYTMMPSGSRITSGIDVYGLANYKPH